MGCALRGHVSEGAKLYLDRKEHDCREHDNGPTGTRARDIGWELVCTLHVPPPREKSGRANQAAQPHLLSTCVSFVPPMERPPQRIGTGVVSGVCVCANGSREKAEGARNPRSRKPGFVQWTTSGASG